MKTAVEHFKEEWSIHLDVCEVCPTLPEDWCPVGNEILGQYVTALKAEQEAKKSCD